MNTPPEPKPARRPNHRLAAGFLLVLFGLATLLGRWLNIGAYGILLIGLAMLAWGCYSRTAGWIIPGSVLTGIGAGILVMEGPWRLVEEGQGGLFLLCFAGGWFLITLLTALFTRSTQWWALIPGGVMTVIGGSILVTNGSLRWQDLNMVYAALLLLAGLALLIFGGRSRKKN